MSQAGEAFEQSILDAENLLKHFDQLNRGPPPPDIEVLKRAGLIMAMTAWETYVEDRVSEAADQRLLGLGDLSIADLVRHKLQDEIKRLHNPTSEKALELFRSYANVDLKDGWCWNGSDAEATCKRLNAYLKLRGEVAHRSRRPQTSRPEPHPVTREDLVKAIRFLRNLVEATESAFAARVPSLG